MARKRKKLLTPLRVILGSLCLLALAVLGFGLLMQGREIAVLNPQGIIAAQQKDLMIFTLLLSVIVVVPVFTMLGLFAWKYRATNTSATYTPDAEGNKWLEMLWWGIPILIIGVLSVVTWVSTHQLDPQKTIASNEKPLTVQVVALQWKWLFLYPEQGVASVNEVHMPVGVPVNFQITADGPMSAFWVPNLGTQVYAMSGMSSRLSLQADNAGRYRGSNTNINGKGYAGMTFTAVAVSKDEFTKWAAATAGKSDKRGDHLDWTRYQQIAKPGKNSPVAYYHLHDADLYSKVIQKFMPSDHQSDESSLEDGYNHGEEY